MRKLLLTIIMADLKRLIFQSKPVIYIEAFVELYN